MPFTDTDLFRALRSDAFEGVFHLDGIAKTGLLYPRFDRSTYTDGTGRRQTRPADVRYSKHATTGEITGVKAGGGTSLFNVVGWFGYKGWEYFPIPNGTEYPAALHITNADVAQEKGALTGTHYQIEPKNAMTVDALKGALDTFARNAVVRSITLSKPRDYA